MVKATAFILTVLLTFSLPTLAQDKGEALDSGEKAALSWLNLVDSGNYGESWDVAASEFQAKISRQKWESTLQSVRTPLGKLESRRLKSATYTTDEGGRWQLEGVRLLYPPGGVTKEGTRERAVGHRVSCRYNNPLSLISR